MPAPSRSPATRVLASILALALGAALSLPCPAAAEGKFIPAFDPSFRYEGRFDFADPAAPVVIWQASRISVDFEGETVALRLADATDACFFNASIDGRTSVVAVPRGKGASVPSFTGLGAGRHTLLLFKRNEAASGTVRFRGIEVAQGATAWQPSPPRYALAMEFVGDSITAGACDEDGPADQWEDRRTHDNAVSYGALVSGSFSADYRNIAVSGIGVALGWVKPTMGQIWDRLYPQADSPRADLRAWTPDVVFVNLGENDDSYPRAHKMAFPAGYTDGYVALVQAIRRAHPSTRIVLLRGGMYGGSQSEPLRLAWDAAVARLEAADPAVSHFVFQHWTSNHPRVADHRAMADELDAWLRKQDFMRAHRAAGG